MSQGRRPARFFRATLWCVAALVAALSFGISHAAPPLDGARARLAALERTFGSIQERYATARDKLSAIEREMSRVELAVRKTARAMFSKQEDAVDLATELYKGGSSDAIEGFLSSRSLADADSRMTYLQFSQEAHAEVFEGLEGDYARLNVELDELETRRAEVLRTVTELGRLRDEFEEAVADLATEVATLQASAPGLQAAESAARDTRATIEAGATSRPPLPGPPYNADWDAIALCESGGRWHLDSTYDGGLQFHPLTWLGYGGGKYAEYAWQASRAEQIAVAEKVLADQGPGAWPHCFKSR